MTGSPVVDQLHAEARDNLYRYVDRTSAWHDRAIAADKDPHTILVVALNVHLKAVTDHETAVALLAVALIELDKIRRSE